MLLGEYTHTLDPKKRLSLPSKFRKEMGKKVILTRGFDKCLYLYTVKGWENNAERLAMLSRGNSDTRQFERMSFAGAMEAEVDSLGRILIPDFLKDFAELKTKVVITGVNDRAEIWDEEKWNAYKVKMVDQMDTLAQKLGEQGMI
jgi:MraZ protein